MRFYTHRHKYYCGIDLHARVMYVCITDAEGTVLVHTNLRTDPAAFERTIEPYREDLAVAVECVFVWYWIADLCAKLGITFVLGHALYMMSHAVRCGELSAEALRASAIHWWEGEERSDRQPEDRSATSKRNAPRGVRVSG